MSMTLWYLGGREDRVEEVQVADCDGLWVTTLEGTRVPMASSYHAYTYTKTSADQLLLARLEAHAVDAEARAGEARAKQAQLTSRGRGDA